MSTTDTMYRSIAAQPPLPADTAARLHRDGFIVIPGPATPGGTERLSEVYDRVVSSADPADIRVASSTRVTDFVSRDSEFDSIYIFPPLLAACCQIIGRPFKLSGTRARTLEPGAPVEAMHVDVRPGGDAWPIVGFILMVDAFDADNGATRFVPGTHRVPREPSESMNDCKSAHEDEALAHGPAGSMIVFNGSVWHSHTANRSPRRRRSLQGHFISRDARSSVDHAARVGPEMRARIGNVAKYVLEISS